MEKLLKYKWYIAIGLGLIVFIWIIRKNSGSTSAVSGNTIYAQPTYSENYLENIASLQNQATMQGAQIQGEIQKQQLINSGQLELARLDTTTALSIAQINSEVSNTAALYGLQAAQSTSAANQAIAQSQYNSQIEASKYSYLSNVAGADAAKYAAQQQTEAAKAQAKAAKNMALYGAIGSVLNTGVGGYFNNQIAGNIRW